MPKIRFPVGDIQGLQPSIDTRGVQKPYGSGNKTYALEGRNFYFDTRGPKSGFGTRLVADNSIIENAGGVVQSITAGKATYVFTSKGCYVMADNRKSWIRVLDLASRWPDVPLKDDKKWTFVYLSKGIYFCHPVYGFYKVVKTPTDYYLDPRDQNDIPGLPFQPQAICETNGRMVVLGFKYVAWSGPSNAEDFLPALGGAGQELLSDRVAGGPVTCVGFQTGFIVWTSQGCLTAEFIGGDTVFRFNRATTEQLPVNAYAVEALPDGSQVICTKQGIFQIQNAQEPQLIAPLFSEFVKQRLEHENGVHVRLTYQLEEDLLFFQMRDWTNHYVHTFVCSLSIDKWGSFNERHLGIIKLIPDRGNWGYVDSNGRPHRFVDVFNREVRPHHFIGLDSNLTIGYIRPPELLAETDSLQEMHEINIGGHPAIPSWYQVDNVDLGRLPSIFLRGNLHLHGFPATFTLETADCENTDQTPTLVLRPQIANNELEDNYDASNNSTDKWWDVISTPAIDYDTGDVFVYSNKSYAYDDPNYITDKTYLNQIPQDGSAITEYYPGVFNDSEAMTHYLVHDNVIFFDRYQPAVWAIHDRYDTAGSALTRAIAGNSFAFQSAEYVTTSYNTGDPDTGLGQTNNIIGFTNDNIILLHEVLPDNDFKLETVDKDIMTRVSQHYIHPGVGNINGAIDYGVYYGNMNFCMGPDGKVYHATSKESFSSPSLFANNTKAALFVYDPVTGTYTDITPWNDSLLPHVGDGVTATNFGVKSIFYDRAKDRIVVIFGHRMGTFFGKSARHVWFWGEWDTHTNTWTNGGRFAGQDYMDAAFAPHASSGATWVSTGIMMLDIAKNVDALPMGSPCMEYLRFLEYILPGDFDFTTGDTASPGLAGFCITVRDPGNNYAVLERFFENDSRYAALTTATSSSNKFIRDSMMNDPAMYEMKVNNELSYTWHLPNKKYMSLYNSIDPFYQIAYGPDWNADNSKFITYVEP